MIGLFDNITKNDITERPWPHITKCDVLSDDLYSILDQTFPEQLICDHGTEVEPGKFRLSLAHISKSKISSTWYDFMTYHASSYFVSTYVNLFKSQLIRKGVSILRRLSAGDYGLRYSNDVRDINIDCQFILEEPHVNVGCHSRTPHYDKPNKICDLLFYMKKEADSSTGRDLLIYEDLPGISYTDGYVTDLSKINLDKTLTYGKNRYVLIPMEKGTSVHCSSPFNDIESVDCNSSDNRRRYFEILIEIHNDTLYTR